MLFKTVVKWRIKCVRLINLLKHNKNDYQKKHLKNINKVGVQLNPWPNYFYHRVCVAVLV